MSGILTVTFNPCIDVNTTVPEMTANEKLRCSTPFRQAGGGGINVARVIKRLGGDPLAIYLAGGDNGRSLRQMLDSEGVRSFVLDTHQPTREDIAVVDRSSAKQYRFVMPGPAIDNSVVNELPGIIERQHDVEFLVVSGSLPPGQSSAIMEELAALASRRQIKMIVDCAGDALRRALASGVYMIKPSVRELVALSGTQIECEHADIGSMATHWVERGDCQAVVVSLGAAGAILVTASKISRIASPAVKTVSTVGAGDSMVAGIVWSLSLGNDLEEAVEYGCACGAAATIHPGTSLCQLSEVESLFSIYNTQIENNANDPCSH